MTRTNWLWDKGDWDAMRTALNNTVSSDVPVRDVTTQVRNISETLLSYQRRFVPSQTYKSKSGDQPWFGFQCRNAADRKNKAWLQYKSQPTRRKHLYKLASKHMTKIQKDEMNSWKDHLKQKLTGQSVGNKEWWNNIKQHQGFFPDNSIPPLSKPDGSVVTCD